MHSLLPAGRFLATYVGRKTIPREQRGGVEYTFRVAEGEYAGEPVSMRLWAPGRIDRADQLLPRDSVEVVVSRREGAAGKRFATVHDFKRIDEPTAADAVRGRDDSTSGATVNGLVGVPGTFRPHPLLTECDYVDAVERDYSEVPDPPSTLPFPLLGDQTAEAVTAAATGAVNSPPARVEDAPDYSDADDDDDECRWVITRTAGSVAASSRLDDDDSPPPLPLGVGINGRLLMVSLFRYLADLPSFMAAHGQSVKGFSGVAWSGWLPVRCVAENTLADILERARLIAVTCARLGVPREQIVVINGWNDALTVLIPSCAAKAPAQVGFERVAGHFAQLLTDLACAHTYDGPMEDFGWGLKLPKDPRVHALIDRRLYGPVAIHPAINSPDERGKLFAVPLSYDELVGLPAADIEKLAASPRTVPRPPWRANEVEALVDLWQYAVKAEELRSKRFAWLTTDTPFVYADTFDWMNHGSDMESAPKRLFRAAVNLLRLGCSRDAVIALLHPAAHLSGLGQQEVEWGVECAARSLVSEGFYMDDDE